MNEKVQALINEAVENMIAHTGSDKKIEGMIKKHDKKIHFIPKKYRVFGNFIE